MPTEPRPGDVWFAELPKESAVNVQGLASFDPGKLTRRLQTLTTDHYSAVKGALRDLLQFC